MKSYKDIYNLPLILDEGTNRVYDGDNNFVFQFIVQDEPEQHFLLDVINDKNKIISSQSYFYHSKGQIFNCYDNAIILIRGWGNLTGIGAHNFPETEAANIQDTFAEFIVERLNKR